MSNTLYLSLEEDQTTIGEKQEVGDLEEDTLIINSDTAVQTNTPIQQVKKEPVPTVLVMKGPLSEIYTKALDIVFANKSNEDTLSIVASESMMNDVIMQAAMKEASGVKKPEMMVLDLSKDYADSNEIAYVTTSEDFNSNKAIGTLSSLSDLSKRYPNANVSLVVDGGSNGRYGSSVTTPEELGMSESTDSIMLKDSMETICNSLGIKTYYSLESFVSALGKKSK